MNGFCDGIQLITGFIEKYIKGELTLAFNIILLITHLLAILRFSYHFFFLLTLFLAFLPYMFL